jgi:hypothetical protein
MIRRFQKKVSSDPMIRPVRLRDVALKLDPLHERIALARRGCGTHAAVREEIPARVSNSETAAVMLDRHA